MGEAPEWKDAATHREPTWPLAGYAPGGYLGKCVRCELSFFNLDKRARHCLPCAMDAIKESEAAARTRIRDLEAALDRALDTILRLTLADSRPVTEADQPTIEAFDKAIEDARVRLRSRPTPEVEAHE